MEHVPTRNHHFRRILFFGRKINKKIVNTNWYRTSIMHIPDFLLYRHFRLYLFFSRINYKKIIGKKLKKLYYSYKKYIFIIPYLNLSLLTIISHFKITR